MQHLQKTRGTSFKPKVSSLHTFPAVRTFKRVDVQTFQRVSSLSPIFRTLFQVPYPASPLFGTLTKTAGVWGYSSHSGTLPSTFVPPTNYGSQVTLFSLLSEYRIGRKPNDRPAPIGALQDGDAANPGRFLSRRAHIDSVESRYQAGHRTSRRAPSRLSGSALGFSPQACRAAACQSASD